VLVDGRHGHSGDDHAGGDDAADDDRHLDPPCHHARSVAPISRFKWLTSRVVALV